MKKLKNLRQLQEVGIYIYKDLLNFCNNNNLKVYLLAGSLLGAVRHKGFIPWDDDIDVGMSRPEYQKLLTLSNNGWISDKCRIIDPEIDGEYKGYIPVVAYDKSSLHSIQFRGNEDLKITLSIFVFDGVPADSLARTIYYKYMYFLRAEHALCRANFKNVNTEAAKKIGPVLSKFYSTKSVYKFKNKILKFSQKYSYEKSEYCGPNSDCGASKEVMRKCDFEEYLFLEFEGIKALAVNDYDSYLKNYYGDYMKLPPEEDRMPKHGVVAEIEDEFEFNTEC